MEEIDKCELVDCWFYIDHTPSKGQGDWGGAIHKGACKLNSTDCKDTPTERCLVKSLYKQLKQKEKECEELKRELRNVENDRRWIKDKCINAGKELGKHSFAWDGKEKNLVIQAMQLNEKYEKLKQALQEIKERVINDCNACKEFEPNRCNDLTKMFCSKNYILQKISEVEE